MGSRDFKKAGVKEIEEEEEAQEAKCQHLSFSSTHLIYLFMKFHHIKC
jgi:hypothetical protein